MKSIFLALFVLAPSFAFASGQCEGRGEAQIIAKVTSSSKLTSHSCRVEIKYPRFYQPNQLCPLDVDDILMASIRVEMSNGVCPAPGQEISGIVVENEDGSFSLE